MKRTVYILTIILLVLVFAVSAFMVGKYVVGSRQQKQAFDDLAQMKEDARNSAATDSTEPEETVPAGTFGAVDLYDENGILIDYSEIYAKNSDTVGWIKIEGTKLDYPVMQTPDRPDHYLKTDFYGNYSEWGCVYAREECDINEPSDNITLYGHTMRDGSMFACLHDYINKETWDNNPFILFDTLTEYHTYKIFAVFKTTAAIDEGFRYHQMIDADDEADFNEFISTCKELAFYDTGLTPVYGDKIICLSTCEYTQEHGRLVVAAYRIS